MHFLCTYTHMCGLYHIHTCPWTNRCKGTCSYERSEDILLVPPALPIQATIITDWPVLLHCTVLPLTALGLAKGD